MHAQILDGSAIAREILAEVRQEAARVTGQTGVTPLLATVLVGDDPASVVYVKRKNKTCQELGMGSRHLRLPAGAPAGEVRDVLLSLNADPAVHGILLQMPLPAGLPSGELLELIDPAKDVDGFHPYNMGRLFLGTPGLIPCTPAGVMELLRRSGISLEGQTAVVAGRSNIVGKPLSALLLQANATVTVCHSRTARLAEVCRQGDILVAAIGRPGLITAEYVKPGAVVVDVGINSVTEEGEIRRITGDSPAHLDSWQKKGYALAGDVEWRTVAPVAGAITPVPGGVGPLTIALLMRNTVRACRDQLKKA